MALTIKFNNIIVRDILLNNKFTKEFFVNDIFPQIEKYNIDDVIPIGKNINNIVNPNKIEHLFNVIYKDLGYYYFYFSISEGVCRIICPDGAVTLNSSMLLSTSGKYSYLTDKTDTKLIFEYMLKENKISENNSDVYFSYIDANTINLKWGSKL